jgi:hypothetical protein
MTMLSNYVYDSGRKVKVETVDRGMPLFKTIEERRREFRKTSLFINSLLVVVACLLIPMLIDWTADGLDELDVLFTLLISPLLMILVILGPMVMYLHRVYLRIGGAYPGIYENGLQIVLYIFVPFLEIDSIGLVKSGRLKGLIEITLKGRDEPKKVHGLFKVQPRTYHLTYKYYGEDGLRIMQKQLTLANAHKGPPKLVLYAPP